VKLVGGYILDIGCPLGHGGFQAQRAQDPRLAEFRLWTDQEGQKVVNDYFRDGVAHCPVDGTEVEVQQNGEGHRADSVAMSLKSRTRLRRPDVPKDGLSRLGIAEHRAELTKGGRHQLSVRRKGDAADDF